MTHLVLFGKGASTTTILCGGNDGDPVIPIAKSKLMKRRWIFLKRSDVSAIVTRKNIKDSENHPELFFDIIKSMRMLNHNSNKVLPLRTCLFL